MTSFSDLEVGLEAVRVRPCLVDPWVSADPAHRLKQTCFNCQKWRSFVLAARSLTVTSRSFLASRSRSRPYVILTPTQCRPTHLSYSILPCYSMLYRPRSLASRSRSRPCFHGVIIPGPQRIQPTHQLPPPRLRLESTHVSIPELEY